ncbi:MAG: tetratricopeptide repeat protein, partial [Leptolyngbya sp. LCM1.Bin17]
MIKDIFLARTEEQQQFRRMLAASLPGGFRKHFPTFAKLIPQQDKHARASIMLFYGIGGMGKTRLMRRLEEIATKEKAFKGNANTLFLDWEAEQKLTLELQVGHDCIEPETVLSVLHQALVKKDWGQCFAEFEQAKKALRTAESKVGDALRQQPENDLSERLSRLGAKGLAYLIRSQPVTGALPQEPLETTLDTTFQVSAEVLHQARRYVQKILKSQEYEIYEQPNRQLAEALGKGLTRLSDRKPLVLFLDTYEIVDRPACDYTLRWVIQETRGPILWIIAGRSNLADSGRRASGYFRGYKGDFAETYLYAKSLSEFSQDLIQQYCAQVVPDLPLNEADAKTLAEFSLGIPFVIRQAVVMYREGKPLAEIVAPVPTSLGSETSSYEQVIKESSERFLKHCFGTKEAEKDLEAIYALALMRRPNPELLQEMVNEINLEGRLQTLRERYSFILVEQVQLDKRLHQFLKEYLLAPLRRTNSMVQRLNETAITWLGLQLEDKTHNLNDTADQLRTETVAELKLALAHHCFWKSEEEGWRYFVPCFVEAWQYRRTWARSLLEVADTFNRCFGEDNRQRLGLFTGVLTAFPDTQTVQRVLEYLAYLEKRSWRQDHAVELKTIRLIKQAELAYQLDRKEEALRVCTQAEKHVPETARQLRKDIAEVFNQIGWKFCVVKGRAIPSVEGKEAFSKAVRLDPNNGKHHNGLGTVYSGLKRYDEAIEAYKKAIDLD